VSDILPILHRLLAGRYVLKREIGRGGAATVYLAHDVRHERLVAIKILHPELSHALGAQRFMREIKLTASLQHPHILPIHDSGEADDQLFYVMPYVEGESLRQRLGVDGRLSMEATVRIGREVAGALAYAHDRGVVHRDIKPENILFSGGHAVLADFGIARAINRASEAITQQGTITGTPAYMSPEQARDRRFDGRSDVYSLSCVLYEAIAGVPPYLGDSPQQLLSQRITKAAPLLREYRHDVPAAIETVIARALSIAPDDRYDDARAFSAALSAAVGHSEETFAPRSVRRSAAHNPWFWAAGAALMLAGGAATTPRARDQLGLLAGRVDTTEYAVVPFQYVGAASPASDAEPASNGVYDAMRQWDGLHLATEMSVSDAVHREGDAVLTLAQVARIARSVRAGRAVWGRVRVTPDSVVVRAGVYDALTGQNLRELTRVVRGGTVGALSALDYRLLVSDLLRASHTTIVSSGADRGTASFPAWQAFERGATALMAWHPAAADRALMESVMADAAYPQASLWLAQLRFLQDSAPTVWTPALAVALQGRAQLDEREQAMATALSKMATGDDVDACRIYDGMRLRDSLDAMAWLGLARCQGNDRGIVRSRLTATGYAFRGSGDASWRAIARALEIAPDAFVFTPYAMLRRVIPVEHNLMRPGNAGSVIFMAFPYLAGDSIAYAPAPAGTAAFARPERVDDALSLDRDRLLGLVEGLARRLPDNPDVFEALTNVLEVRDEITGTPNGRYSALTALERARTLSSSPDQRLRLAVADVRLHLKLGDFARSTAMTDSLLTAHVSPTQGQAYLLRGLAEYTGRPGLAAHFDRLYGTPDYRGGIASLPPVEDAASALVMRTALGVCDDSVTTLLRSIDATLASYVDAERRPTVRQRIVERALTLAAPCDGAKGTLELSAGFAPIVQVLQRIARGDRRGARRELDSLEARRTVMQPGAISLDVVMLESWAREAGGDAAGAAARLDLSLGALPALSPQVVTEPGMAAALGRTMAYRADLAVRLGDAPTAALWAGRVLTVWAHADSALTPTMSRMRGIASRPAVRRTVAPR
jgi:tRNA A-37 threonylcarbamoyl transferase component Bud32